MASPATDQAPLQQSQQPRSGGRGRGEEASLQASDDQHYKGQRAHRGNPPHKKDWQQKRGYSEEQQQQDFKGPRTRSRDYDENGNDRGHNDKGPRTRRGEYDDQERANGSGEYRERGSRRRNKEANGTANGTNGTNNRNVNGTSHNTTKEQPNGNPATYPPHLESTIEEAKRINALIPHEEPPNEKELELITDLAVVFPNISHEDILQVIRRHRYQKDECIQALAELSEKSYPSWTQVVRSGKPKQQPPQQQPSQQPPQQQPSQQQAGAPAAVPPTSNNAAPLPPRENSGRKDRRRAQDDAQQGQQQQPPQQTQRRERQHQLHQQQPPAYVQQPQQPPQQPPQPQQPQPQPPQPPQDAVAPFGRGDDMLSGLSQAIEHQLAEVQRKNQMLTLIKTELDAINNSDLKERSALEAEKQQLEVDRQHYMEQLRRVEERLREVELSLKHAEEAKAQKVQDLYASFRSNGLLLTAN